MDGKPKTFGFGFNPDHTHYFEVHIPIDAQDSVVIMERFDSPNSTIIPDRDIKILLSYEKWQAISAAVQAEFNRHTPGHWQPGFVPLAPLLGKELVLLAWAIEDADPVLIPRAIQNWLGLAREERWWLFTETNAATGHYRNGRGKGWRKAVRYALTENPVSA